MARQQGATPRWHDPNHGWVNGQQVEAPCSSARLRLFSPLCLTLPEDLPEVHAVTRLVIRRQLRHQIFPAALRLLLERLPRLENIVYEPWRAWRCSSKGLLLYRQPICMTSNTMIELASAIQKALPSHIKIVSIFEDADDQLALKLRHGVQPWDHVDINPATDPRLARAFASKSRDFEHLSISYMIDAQQIFNSCRPRYTWRHLQSLTLTPSILTQLLQRRFLHCYTMRV